MSYIINILFYLPCIHEEGECTEGQLRVASLNLNADVNDSSSDDSEDDTIPVKYSRRDRLRRSLFFGAEPRLDKTIVKMPLDRCMVDAAEPPCEHCRKLMAVSNACLPRGARVDQHAELSTEVAQSISVMIEGSNESGSANGPRVRAAPSYRADADGEQMALRQLLCLWRSGN